MGFGGGSTTNTWRQLFMWSVGDTVNNLEIGPMCGDSNAVGSNNNRTSPFARRCELSHMMLVINTNSNTVDDAEYIIRITPYTDPFVFFTGNMNIQIDQATGLFEDLTNTDVLSNGGVLQGCHWMYLQGDSTVLVRSIACEGVGT